MDDLGLRPDQPGLRFPVLGLCRFSLGRPARRRAPVNHSACARALRPYFGAGQRCCSRICPLRAQLIGACFRSISHGGSPRWAPSMGISGMGEGQVGWGRHQCAVLWAVNARFVNAAAYPILVSSNALGVAYVCTPFLSFVHFAPRVTTRGGMVCKLEVSPHQGLSLGVGKLTVVVVEGRGAPPSALLLLRSLPRLQSLRLWLDFAFLAPLLSYPAYSTQDLLLMTCNTVGSVWFCGATAGRCRDSGNSAVFD